MSRFRLYAAWTVLVILFFSISACAPKERVRSAHDTTRFITEHDLRNLPATNIPVVINDRVIAWMEYFQGPGRNHFKRYLERSSRYLPLMKAILREQGMPTDLVYIALIESGFNNHAYSRAAAVGPWQFIYATGRRYGLTIDDWVDERRDPVRSTYAAARMFRDLYKDYDDWYLAMVGYNAGPGRVSKAIEMTGSRDFWEIADHGSALKAETRDYVPKFIAALIMAKSPEKFGFGDLSYQEPWEHESSEVVSQTDISVIAKCAGVSEEVISDLNPHLIRGATPPYQRDYKIRLPRGSVQTFKLAYANIPEDERIQLVRHSVTHGETMNKIAHRYGISVNALAKANGLSRKSRLHNDTVLIIPVGSYAAKYALASNSENDDRPSSKHLIRYKVKKGDTINKIASRYPGVTVSKLKQWNNLGSRSHIRIGQNLKIYTKEKYAKSSAGESPKWHTIKRGETIGGIAARYGTTSNKLLALNNIKDARSIKAGKKIKVNGDNSSPSSTLVKKETPETSSTDINVPQETTDSAIADTAAAHSTRETKAASTHRVRPGETLGAIAAKYGVNTKQLMALNGIKDSRKIRAGQTLKITKGTIITKKSAVSDAGTTTKKTVVTDTVKNGDQVASSNTITNSDQNAVNDTSIKQAPQSAPAKTPEPKIAAVHKKTITYRVRSGETLWDIARIHNVTIAQLQQWNNLSDPSSVRSGTTLKIIKD